MLRGLAPVFQPMYIYYISTHIYIFRNILSVMFCTFFGTFHNLFLTLCTKSNYPFAKRYTIFSNLDSHHILLSFSKIIVVRQNMIPISCIGQNHSNTILFLQSRLGRFISEYYKTRKICKFILSKNK